MTKHDSVTTPRERRGGFSLIEVMLAIGILGFGILALTAAQISSMRFSSDSRNHTLAMKLAEDQMETLLVMTPADVQALILLPAGGLVGPDPGDGNPMTFVRRTLVDVDTPEVGVMTMTVEVDWTSELGMVRTARVQSFKAGS